MAFSYDAFSACVSDRWQLAIGDPYIVGWLVCAAYALAAILALIVQRETPFELGQRMRERALWLLIACLMMAFALNKQLDLQSLLIAGGRCLAQEQGWYDGRNLVQQEIALVLTLFVALAAAAMVWLLHGIIRRNLLALLGLAVLALFVLIRAGSLLKIIYTEQWLADLVLHSVIVPLELLSAGLIIIATLQRLRPTDQRRFAKTRS